MQYSLSDYQYMAEAIALAKKGRFTTTPNPNVGCLIVKNHKIIGRGWHKKAGSGHAEVNALRDLTFEQSSGATAYVTLEPCSHFGRTPPCAQLLIDSGIKKVFVAMLDTNPQVSGKGITMLQQAGIEVQTGLLEQEARCLNLGFFSRIEKKRPYIKVKMACSIDGKVALENGDSQWITGKDARSDVQTHRALSSAVLSTAKTVLMDNATLNVRQQSLNFEYPIDETNTEIRQPIRLILDSKNQITLDKISSLSLFSEQSTIVLFRNKLTNEFAKIDWITEVALDYQSGFDLTALLGWCTSNEINDLWVEAGSTLAASFIEQSIFDELIIYQAPKIMGATAQDVLPLGPFNNMSQIFQLKMTDVTQVGSDLRMTYTIG
ncbi:MAG: bifunctional diaminohydroxyphosphoribosylaminopyrimidine deaminase/5-amino-6-(5-phosphoribosylamino)uracil reductase RibD [Gammaproteobacteria bacterium]|nr:bifunctional diaminohydroxyphosphoribosylaminopyrimidine deaminase/5-amino-6-(5-phosphoribosylamino)uracil reductase RibD [Gammaproteobacteria bacterium]